MLVGVIYYAITGGGTVQLDTIIAAVFSIAWLVVGFAFLYGRQIVKGVPVLHPEDYKEAQGLKMETVGATSD